MSRTKKLVVTAILAAVALGVYVLEAQIPAPIPVPGVKLGLANIVTLAAMILLGRKQAFAVLLVRLLLGSMFSGGFSALLYSLAGGVFAYAVMAALFNMLPIWVISVLAAIAHNLAQLVVAVLVTGTPGLFWYGPALLLAAIVTGAFTGLASNYLTRALRGKI
ncbi:MAG: Gx transporter family protein [Oscillospiraceae bacterium]|nr:Gx transporter family protein [Oscillospiraceae bacterium]